MAIIDIHRLLQTEDLLVDGAIGQIGWGPRRLTSMEIDDQSYLVMGAQGAAWESRPSTQMEGWILSMPTRRLITR